MNTIDNLQQGKLAGSLSNNTIIGTKNPLDQIIIENLKNKKLLIIAKLLCIVNVLTSIQYKSFENILFVYL